ncbi:MAG: response regulator [Cyanobacteria bacterium J06627_28]
MSSSARPYMLVVEDSNEDFAALQRVLSKHCKTDIPIKRCDDGDDALDFIYHRGAYSNLTQLPQLIVLDLNLPGTDGREVLTQIKQHEQLKQIPIVIFTTSSNPKDIASCYQRGANSYLVKPMSIEQLKKSVCSLIQYWFEVAVLPAQG